MRRACLAAAFAALLPAVAPATSISMNEVVLPQGATLETCKAAARDAVSRAGLAPLPEAPASVFGEGQSGLIAAIYCLPDRGIAMIGVAAESNDATRATLFALMQAMRSA
jgi:hypothetical protein